MTDIPTASALEEAAINNSRFELIAGSTTAGNDKLIAVRDVDVVVDPPEQRTDHGEVPIYTHAAPDITLDFTVTLTHDLFAYMRTRGSINTNGTIPKYKWGFKVTPQGGSANARTIVFNGKLTRRHVMRRDEAGVPSQARYRVRVTDAAEPAAT